jgi:hypothetical protein
VGKTLDLAVEVGLAVPNMILGGAKIALDRVSAAISLRVAKAEFSVAAAPRPNTQRIQVQTRLALADRAESDADADLWHQVHAQREDGAPAMFLVRDVEPRNDQPQIFVVQMPYSVTDLSRLPDAAGYRRLDAFQDQWIEPACASLGWTFVAWKSEDGSFYLYLYLYLYGDGDPQILLKKLAPFDDSLGFFNDRDAKWAEYAALRELVEQAEAAPKDSGHEDGEKAGTVPVIIVTSSQDPGLAPAPDPKGRPADVVSYEINMLRHCYGRLVPTPPADLETLNVYLEAYLVHYRVLLEFFAPNHGKDGKRYPKDLSVHRRSAWATRSLSDAEIAAVTAGAAPLRKKWFESISQQLSHCTQLRYENKHDWPIETMHPAMEAVITIFDRLQAIARDGAAHRD